MHFATTCLLVLAAAGASFADAQYGFGLPSANFRAGLPQPSIEQAASQPEGRFFFTTVTVTIATTTSTVVLTTSSTCTTTTAAASICSPSGRRRRMSDSYGAKNRAGLMFNDDDDLASIFLPLPEKVEEPKPVEPERVARQAPQVETVPYVVQPGFRAPEAAGRFLVAFGTSTVFTTSTSTYLSSLTAVCKSTTGFQTCGSSGK